MSNTTFAFGTLLRVCLGSFAAFVISSALAQSDDVQEASRLLKAKRKLWDDQNKSDKDK